MGPAPLSLGPVLGLSLVRAWCQMQCVDIDTAGPDKHCLSLSSVQ